MKYLLVCVITILTSFLNLCANGKHITANGNLHALILFIQFDDDTLISSDEWTYDSLSLPKWSFDFIDSTKLPTGKSNLTQYFYEMSNGKFLLTGNIYPKLIRPKFASSHYKNIGEVNYEILTMLDSSINFSKYDNWTRLKNGLFVDSSDGLVDMIYLIYRNFENRLFFNQGWSGSAELYLSKDIETNDGVTIQSGKMFSGIQMRGGKHGFNYSKYVAAHELGHFFLGAGHIEGMTNLALMTGGPVWNASRGMFSWEREKLGWTKYTDINTAVDSSYTLRDYMTSNEALRIKLSEFDWYVFENRQKISRHDAAGDKGIYIYHVNDRKSRLPKAEVKSADGFWDFAINTTEKILRKDRPNVNGKSELNFIKRINKKTYSCYEEVYGSNDAWGDDTDAFDLTYNNVLSPVSNPSSGNSFNTPFSVEIVEQKDGVYKIQFYFNDVYAGSPSKPQNFNASIDSLNRIILTWKPNMEPDILRYHVYKKSINDNEWELLDIVFHQDVNEIQWIDETNKLSTSDKVQYSISAIDVDVNESVKTDYCFVEYDIENNKWVVINTAYK